MFFARNRTVVSSLTATLMLSGTCLIGCASAPGLGRVGAVRLTGHRPAGQAVALVGRDCTATVGGGNVRAITAATALQHGLEQLGLPQETVIYEVESTTTSGPETCIQVRGVVVLNAAP